MVSAGLQDPSETAGGSRLRRESFWLASALILSAMTLDAKVIGVPRDFPTIGAAVAAARDGDTVEIGDGIYVEENIILDKAIRLRAERTYGPVIYSLGERRVPVFIVRAAVDIQGLVIKNCYEGIKQRHSPDVSWTGRDLIFQNIVNSAVSVNDVSANVGRAFLYNIIVEGVKGAAFATNDAQGIYLRNALITGCDVVFANSNSFFFDVDRVAFSNCKLLQVQDRHDFPPPATNEIRLGPNILDLDALFRPDQAGGFPQVSSLDRFFDSGDGDGTPGGFEVGQGLLLASLGRICLERGDSAAAADYMRRAQNIGRAIRYDGLILASYHGLARAEQKLGRKREALADYDEAIALVVDLNDRLPLRIYNEGFLRDKLEIFEEAISLLVELHSENPGRRLDRQAFLLADRLKMLGFYDNLLDYRSELEASSAPAFRTKLGGVSRRISLLNIRLQEESLPREERQASLRELEAAENVYKSLMVQMRNRNPRMTGFVGQRPLGFRGSPKDFPGKNEAVLEYLVGKNRVFGILVSEDGVIPAALGDPDILSRLTLDYLKFLSLRSEGDFKATKGGAKLGDFLLQPFKGRLSRNIEQLIVVPDGVLHALPFGALIWEAPETAGRAGARAPGMFLAERFAISYAPSVSSLISIRERPRSARRDMDLLAVMDSRAKSFWHLSTSRRVFFPALKSVAEEVEAILRPFSPGKRMVLEDGRASERAFRGLPLDRFKIIHIATHAHFDDENWERSGVLLGRQPGSTEDGILRPTDLYDLHLNTDLVVLSGCQTAKGRAPAGTGLFGLSMSFLATGSRAVLASLWNVDDQSTARFMGRFYHYLAEKKTLAGALQAAKSDMIRSHDRHPFFWAAFVLIGDGQGGL